MFPLSNQTLYRFVDEGVHCQPFDTHACLLHPLDHKLLSLHFSATLPQSFLSPQKFHHTILQPFFLQTCRVDGRVKYTNLPIVDFFGKEWRLVVIVNVVGCFLWLVQCVASLADRTSIESFPDRIRAVRLLDPPSYFSLLIYLVQTFTFLLCGRGRRCRLLTPQGSN